MADTPEELLDDMLRWFAYNDGSRPWGTLNEATRDYHHRHHPGQSTQFLGNLRELTVSKIIDKLLKDRYIKVRGRILDTGELQYTATFDGLVHIRNGGYVTATRRQSQKDFNLKARNLILTAGSLLAGMYSLWKLFSHFDSLLSVNLMTFLCVFFFGLASGIIIYMLILEVLSRRRVE